jgi:hypothetical protein
MYIQIPVKTEVIEKNGDICTNGKVENGKVVIGIDTRRRDYKKILNVPRGKQIQWMFRSYRVLHGQSCIE